jgi:diguanylate cyclase (GGDEF)-like protein
MINSEEKITQEMAKETHDYLRSMKDKYQQDTLRDGLTGLFNRKALDKDLVQLKSVENYSMAFLDIDYFKKFNDHFGHDVGDIVLKDVSKVAESISRGEQDLVYRYGGEEIIIIFKGLLSKEILVEKAEELRKKVQKIEIRTIEKTAVTISLGLTSKRDEDRPTDVLIRAETAMRQAKILGKNQYMYR